MTVDIKIIPADGKITVRANGAVIGETTAALELWEGGRGPTIYVPRADMAMAMLEPSTHQTTCPHKGKASYYSIVTPAGTLKDAVWS